MRPGPSPCPRPVRGFTLIELMVVIVILGGLIALVGPNVFRSLREANQRTAQLQMGQFQSCIDMYTTTHRRLPASLMTLTETSERSPEPLLARLPRDPWGNPYDFRPTSQTKYTLRSWGEDQQPDTADDIVWPDPDER